MKVSKVARVSIGIMCAFSVLASPALAGTVVFDAEAERAELEGMAIEERLSITHVLAEEKYEGSVTFAFEVPEDGRYLFEAKTIAVDKQHDSFEVALDDKDSTPWHVPQSSTWQWNPIGLDGAEEGVLELQDGDHTLTLYGREITRLDRVKISLIEATESDDHVNDEQPAEDSDNDVPVEQNDEVSGDYWYVSTNGSDNDNGSKGSPFKTIGQALEKAGPGDIVLVAGGTYREEIVTVRSGTKTEPITITALDPNNRPVLDLDWDLNGPIIRNSYIILKGFEIRDFDEGVRIEGATGVQLLNNEIHHGQNECVRVRYTSTKNRIEGNTIHFCGALSSTDRMDSGNGEGIYLGTAPEQREKNGGEPDQSVYNEVIGNRIYDVTEGIDLKEDSHFTLVRDNIISESSDANSGGINVRGDNNTIEDNVSYDNNGSGFRFGGDSAVDDPSGSSHDYGINNTISGNESRNNSVYGYKFMRDDQNFACDNIAEGNGKGDSNNSEVFACKN